MYKSHRTSDPGGIIGKSNKYDTPSKLDKPGKLDKPVNLWNV